MMPIFKWLLLLQALVALVLQSSLWFSDASLLSIWKLDRQIAQYQQDNQLLIDRNQRVLQNIASLKQRGAAIEEQARLDLGMIRPGETYYYFLDPGDGS
jgi:cell division protein FtsB